MYLETHRDTTASFVFLFFNRNEHSSDVFKYAHRQHREKKKAGGGALRGDCKSIFGAEEVTDGAPATNCGG